MKLKNERKNFEGLEYCEIIFNLTDKGCKRYEQDYEYVYQLLELPDDYEIPYECYEVIYDWDDFGVGDGKDAVCFYSKKPGFLEKNELAKEIYGEPEEEE